jgi:PHD/YefM family antitoxin component YafN of YafNO toxin-antitoxin module
MVAKRIENLRKMPRTILGVTELRRSPQDAFALAQEQETPVLVTEFNKLQGVILSLDTFDDVIEALNRAEIEDALDSAEVYRREKSAGVLKKLKSLEQLVGDEN